MAEELSARVTLDDSQLPQVASRVERSLREVGASMVEMGQKAEVSDRGSRRLFAGLSLLTRGALRLDDATGQLVDSKGREASASQILNRIGIQTTQQIQLQIAAVADLAGAYEQNSHEALQLQAIQRRLQEQLSGVTVGGRAAAGSIHGMNRSGQQLSFLLNDLQQFSYGFSFGLRSISNNLGPLIYSLGGTSSAIGPLIIAVEAISTGLVLWTSRTKGQTDTLKEMKKEVGNVVSSLIELQSAQEGTAKVRLQDARNLAGIFKEQAKALKENVDQINAFKSKQEKPIAFAKVVVTLNKESVALLAEANGNAAEALKLAKQRTEAAGALAGEMQKQVVLEEARVISSKMLKDQGVAITKDFKEQKDLASSLRRTQAFLADEAIRQAEGLKAAGKNTLFLAKQMGIFKSNLPKLDAKVDPIQDIFDDAIIGSMRFERQLSVGVVPAADAAKANVQRLRDALQGLTDAGQQNSVMFSILKDRMKVAERQLFAFEVAVSVQDALAEGVANVVTGIESLNDALESTKLLLRDVLRDIIKAGLVKIGAGIIGGILSGPPGAAAGAGVGGGLVGAFGRAAAPQVVGIVRGPDLQLITRENARRVGG